MRRVLQIMFVALMSLLLMSGALAEAAPGTVESIRERGVLRVGSTGDYNPMSFLDPETGEYVGFDAELAEDLAA